MSKKFSWIIVGFSPLTGISRPRTRSLKGLGKLRFLSSFSPLTGISRPRTTLVPPATTVVPPPTVSVP